MEREKEKGKIANHPSAGLLPTCFQWYRLDQHQNLEVGTQPRYTTWVSGTQIYESILLPLRIFISTKLELNIRCGYRT